MVKSKIANQSVKNRLLVALIDLIGKNDLSKLTVTQLIEKSGVARASFYRNFNSVKEIIDYGIMQMSLRYDEKKPYQKEDFRNRDIVLYKFRYYKEYAELILAFHHAKVSTTLLDIITECVIDASGDMPISCISKYELYFFSGAFYNVMLYWLESGMKETPEAMTDEFLRIINRQ